MEASRLETSDTIIHPIRINGHPARALIDSGANASFISEGFAERHQLCSVDTPSLTVRVANGEAMKRCRLYPGLRLHLGNYDFVIDCTSGQLAECDVIIGMPFLKRYQFQVNFANSFLSYPPPPPLDLVSLAAVVVVHSPKSTQPLSVDAVSVGAQRFTSPNEPPSPTDSTDGRVAIGQAPSELFASGPGLDKKERTRLAHLVYEDFRDVFRQELPNSLPPLRPGFDHAIRLKPDAKPHTQPPRKMSVVDKARLDTDINAWLANGWIRRSESEWGAPIHYVPKSNGERRLVMDYRGLNACTIPNAAGLPSSEEMIDQLYGSRVWSKLDATAGYCQLRIRPGDEFKTAFRCRFGHFEWLVMPFGLINAPASFQAFMHHVLSSFLDVFVIVFLDDILVFSENLKEHEKHLRQVLQSLRDNAVYLKPSKCNLFATSITFLGHNLTSEGMSMMPDKVDCILSWPLPRTARQVREFLGLVQFYRRYIRFCSKLTAPISDLLRKTNLPDAPSKTIKWSAEAEQSFHDLKEALSTAPVLSIADPSLPYIMHCDASDVAIGAALSQQNLLGEIHPIEFFSKKLTDTETRYATHDRELYAVICAFKHWRHYLEGATVTVLTDHQALQHFKKQPHLSSRQYRWALFLSHFNYDIYYQKGSANHVADALSRHPSHDDDSTSTHGPLQTRPRFLDRHSPEAAALAITNALTLHSGDLVKRLREAQRADSFCRPIFEDLKHESNRQLQLTLRDDCLVHGELYFVPSNVDIKQRIFLLAHDDESAGHYGIAKTMELVSRFFWWPSLRADTVEYVRRCERCQVTKIARRPKAGELVPLPVPLRPFTSISLDFIVRLPLTESGHDAALVVVDRSTKYAHFIPTTVNVDAAQTHELLTQHVYRHHGYPLDITSDRDTRFTSHFWKEMQRVLNIKLRMSSAFHPATDGQTERLNAVLEGYLRSFCSFRQEQWDQWLHSAEMSYNNSQHSSTGFSPFFLLFGFHPRLALSLHSTLKDTGFPAVDDHLQRLFDTRETAQANMSRAIERMKTQADKRRSDLKFKVGDSVLLSIEHLNLPEGVHKLYDRYIGPYTVLELVGRNAYRLDLPSHSKIHPVINIERLKPYLGSGSDFPDQPRPARPPAVLNDQGESTGEYEVESILGKRQRGRTTEYLVHWAGYPHSDDQWLPKSRMQGSAELIQEFEAMLQDPGSISSSLHQSIENSAQDEAELCRVSLHRILGEGPSTRVIEGMRCQGRTKSGAQCSRRTNRGTMCWQHSTSQQNIRIKTSTLPGAGLGLFAGAKGFKRGEEVAKYTGPLVQNSDPDHGGDFAVGLNRHSYIDGGSSRNIGSYINDCRSRDKRQGLCAGDNVEWRTDRSRRRIRMTAKKPIAPGEETFIRYGEQSYWKDKERHAAQLQAAHSPFPALSPTRPQRPPLRHSAITALQQSAPVTYKDKLMASQDSEPIKEATVTVQPYVVV